MSTRRAKRRPKDKARVEQTVRDVRDDCFAGEKLLDLDDARRRGRTWSAEECGMRRHTMTQGMPREHFETDEKPHLLPTPMAPYDIPIWCDPKVGADQHAQVARALYSLPFEWRNKRAPTKPRSSQPDHRRARAPEEIGASRAKLAEADTPGVIRRPDHCGEARVYSYAPGESAHRDARAR